MEYAERMKDIRNPDGASGANVKGRNHLENLGVAGKFLFFCKHSAQNNPPLTLV
jgi:hypothetical protein